MAYRRRGRKSGRKVSFLKHRHISKPMGGLTSIPVRFRGRRFQ